MKNFNLDFLFLAVVFPIKIAVFYFFERRELFAISRPLTIFKMFLNEKHFK